MWRSGNLELNGRQYIFEILMNEFPGRLGIFGGRIIQLYLYDDQDQIVAEYSNTKWNVSPERGTDASELVKVITKEHNFRKRKYAA